MKLIAIIVDMQNGFASSERIQELGDRIDALLQKDLFDAVIATRFLNGDHSPYERFLDWTEMRTDEDIQLLPSILPYVDLTVDKQIYTCVNADFLQMLCQLNDGTMPEKVFLMGVDTDCCVLATATGLFENDIRPVVLTAYCDSTGGAEYHEAGLLCLKRLIGEKQLYGGSPETKHLLDSI